MSAKLKIKRGTTTSWADSANKDTTLEPGQLGVEYLDDGNMRLKVGKQTDNGSATDWSSLPYVTPSTSVYQDNMLIFSRSGGDSTFTIMGKLTGVCKLVQKTDVTNTSTISLTVNSTASGTFGSVSLNSYSDDGAPSLNSSNTRLGCPNTPWIKGYITDIYTNRLHVNTDSYGSTIPTSGSEGQLFFQIYS